MSGAPSAGLALGSIVAVTLLDGQAVGSEDTTAPKLAAVSCTGYGLLFATVKKTSPSAKPG